MLIGEEKQLPKKVLVVFNRAMLQEIDTMAQTEHRTRSDLIREAVRYYATKFRMNQTPAAVLAELKNQILNTQPV